MKIIRLSLRSLPVLFIATFLNASPVEELSLEESGIVRVNMKSFEMLVVPAVIDTSTGTWGFLSPAQPFPIADGTSVSGSAPYRFPGGANLTLSMDVKLSRNVVDVSASWQIESDGAGFIRVDLYLPSAIAQNLLLRSSTRTVALSEMLEEGGFGLPSDSKLLFSNESSGQTLFTVSLPPETSVEVRGGISLSSKGIAASFPNNPDKGVLIRLSSYPRGHGLTDLVGTQLSTSWQITFEEP